MTEAFLLNFSLTFSCYTVIAHLLHIPSTFVPKVFHLHDMLFSTELNTGKHDVVFLIDGSDSSQSGFPAVRDFIRRVVENLNLAKDKDRIAVVQYSGDTKVHFYLRSHSTKEAVIRIIRTLRHKGGRERNTGEALHTILDKVLIAPAGSRHEEGVKQVLILVSSGPSNDSFIKQATSLHAHGILSIIIGMNPVSPPLTPLKKTFLFPINDFRELPDILLDVLFTLRQITGTGKLTNHIFCKCVVK